MKLQLNRFDVNYNYVFHKRINESIVISHAKDNTL